MALRWDKIDLGDWQTSYQTGEVEKNCKMFANPVFITPGSFIVKVSFLYNVWIFCLALIIDYTRNTCISKPYEGEVKAQQKEKKEGWGKIVILSTSTSTQFPKPKTSERKMT